MRIGRRLSSLALAGFQGVDTDDGKHHGGTGDRQRWGATTTNSTRLLERVKGMG
jgi:hypothetical protein